MDTCTAASHAGIYRALEWKRNAAGGRDAGLGSPLRQTALAQVEGYPGPQTGAHWFRQRISDLRRNPDFGAVAIDVARNSVQLFEGRYLVNKAMANVARQTVCVAILSLYFGQSEKNGGAFLSSIQTLTTTTGVCSKNTAAATVALLERLGLVVRVENPSDRRWHHIQPTANLISAARDFNRISLMAADALLPPGNHGRIYDANPVVQERCFSVGLYSYIALHTSIFNLAHSGAFLGTDGGIILLYKLMSLKGMAEAASEPVVEFPFEEIGALFGLSRTHIRRLMIKAEAAGFVQLLQRGGRQVRILPPLADLFENIVAASVVRSQLDIGLALAEDFPIRTRR